MRLGRTPLPVAVAATAACAVRKRGGYQNRRDAPILYLGGTQSHLEGTQSHLEVSSRTACTAPGPRCSPASPGCSRSIGRYSPPSFPGPESPTGSTRSIASARSPTTKTDRKKSLAWLIPPPVPLRRPSRHDRPEPNATGTSFSTPCRPSRCRYPGPWCSSCRVRAQFVSSLVSYGPPSLYA